MMSGISVPRTLEDLLNKIEKYLRDVLSKEKLSYGAEKQRKNLVEQIEVVKLPPSLPPMREEKKIAPTANTESPKDVADGANIDDGLNLYEDPKESGYIPKESAYLEPKEIGSMREQVPEADDSGTDYDNEESDDEFNELRRDSIPLPTKKIQGSKKGDLPLCQLTNILHLGEVFQKSGMFNKLARHFCALSDDKLIVYKSKEDSRPANQLQLLGCEVTYVEKDGRFQNVVKIIQDGEELLWFSTTTKKNAGIWLQYLKSVCAGKGPPDKIEWDYLDTVDATSDEGLGTSLQQSSSSDTTVPSSAEGSGDGVITSSGPQATPTSVEKSSKSGNVLSKLKNTLGKKSKVALQLKEMDGEEVFKNDPDVKIASYAKVKCEALMRNKKWNTFYCVVKNQSIECYKNLENISAEVSFSLAGVAIESAGLLDKKHELALKLTQDQTVMFLELSSKIDHGNWLSVLVKESGCGSPPATFSPLDDGEGEIYEVVHDFTPTEPSKVLAHGGSSDNIPPPLPRNPPPVRTPPDIKRPFEGQVEMEESEESDEDDEAGFVYEAMQHKTGSTGQSGDSYELSRPVGEDDDGDVYMVSEGDVYDDIISGTEVQESSKEAGPKRQVGELIGRIKENLHRESTFPKVKEESDKSETKNSQVVACATGPTIAEDKDLLDKTSNPLLSELRKTKGQKKGSKDLDKVVDQISVLKKEILTLKERRIRIRSKRLEVRNPSQRNDLQKELQEVDTELDEKEKELTKLRVIAQEQSPSVVRNHSFGSESNKKSPNVSRNSSFSSGTASPKNSPRSSFNMGKPSSTSLSSGKPKAQKAASNTLPAIKSKTNAHSKTVSVKSTYAQKNPSSTGSKSSVKSNNVKKSELRAQGTRPCGPNSKTGQSQPASANFIKTTSLDNIPKVKDMMKMFESKPADSK